MPADMIKRTMKYVCPTDGREFNTHEEAKAHESSVQTLRCLADLISLRDTDSIQAISRIVSKAESVQKILAKHVRNLPKKKNPTLVPLSSCIPHRAA